MKIIRRNQYEVISYVLLLIISFTFLLFRSQYTSPLYSNYGDDSSMFLFMGRMLLDVKTPYIDFFDHKGPIIIFIEAFAQLIYPGRLGVFIFQVFNMTLALVVANKISRCFLKEINSFTCSISLLSDKKLAS